MRALRRSRHDGCMAEPAGTTRVVAARWRQAAAVWPPSCGQRWGWGGALGGLLHLALCVGSVTVGRRCCARALSACAAMVFSDSIAAPDATPDGPVSRMMRQQQRLHEQQLQEEDREDDRGLLGLSILASASVDPQVTGKHRRRERQERLERVDCGASLRRPCLSRGWLTCGCQVVGGPASAARAK